MQWTNLLRAAQKSAFRVAAAIIEVDHIIERGGLAVAEIRGSLRDLAQPFGAPQAWRNGLAAKIAIARGSWIITEVSIDVKVAIRDRGSADECLVGCAPGLRGIGMGR